MNRGNCLKEKGQKKEFTGYICVCVTRRFFSYLYSQTLVKKKEKRFRLRNCRMMRITVNYCCSIISLNDKKKIIEIYDLYLFIQSWYLTFFPK
jgi:hypothetical protein